MNSTTPSPTETTLTRKDICRRWGNCSVRTVARAERKFRMRPLNFIGLEPIFTLAEVLKAENARMQDRRRTLGKLAAAAGSKGKATVVSVKAAKSLAGRGNER